MCVFVYVCVYVCVCVCVCVCECVWMGVLCALVWVRVDGCFVCASVGACRWKVS